MRPLLATPIYPAFCQHHDGPPVMRAEDSRCCEHADPDEDGVPSYFCYCGAEGEWP
jgi:hypothetical protein